MPLNAGADFAARNGNVRMIEAVLEAAYDVMRRSGWLALWAAWGLTAQELPRGQVLERVTVQDDERQSYALYVPANYSPDRAWPILYCLDPGARGRVPVERFAA